MNNFSIVKNNGKMFPNLPVGDVVVFGDHYRSFAKCDYEGNANCSYPDKPLIDKWVVLSKDYDSVMAWHGKRKRSNNLELVLINWKIKDMR